LLSHDLDVPFLDLRVRARKDFSDKLGVSPDCSPKREISNGEFDRGRMHVERHSLIEMRKTLVDEFPIRG
jgi:hypothetical protein